MEDDAWQMRAPYYSLVEPLLLLSLKVVQMERLFSFFFFLRYYRQDLYRDCAIYQPEYLSYEAKALIKGKKYYIYIYCTSFSRVVPTLSGLNIFPSFSQSSTFSEQCFHISKWSPNFSMKKDRNRRVINFQRKNDKVVWKGKRNSGWFEGRGPSRVSWMSKSSGLNVGAISRRATKRCCQISSFTNRGLLLIG